MIGHRFGRLVAMSRIVIGRKSYYDCLCDCGMSHRVRRDHLCAGKIKSCGCWHDEAARIINTKHGHHPRGQSTPEYRAWAGMIDRCYRTSGRSYPDYGGRGIRVCAQWRHDFSAFLNDVGMRPSTELSIDRIDVNGDYEPVNVRWASRITQARNVRNIKHISAFGIQRTLAEWAEATGIDKRKIFCRLNVLGWTPERAFSEGAL